MYIFPCKHNNLQSQNNILGKTSDVLLHQVPSDKVTGMNTNPLKGKLLTNKIST